MNENLKNAPPCDEAYNSGRIELEKEALSIITSLPDEQLLNIMEEMRGSEAGVLVWPAGTSF